MTNLQIDAIVAEFDRRGYAVEYDYPGFFSFEKNGATWVFGDWNETWTTDHYPNALAFEEACPSEFGFDTALDANCVDPQELAGRILTGITISEAIQGDRQ